MANIDDQELKDSLETCVLDLHSAIAAEVNLLGTELSKRLAIHFVDAITHSCANIRNEEMRMRQHFECNIHGCETRGGKDTRTAAPLQSQYSDSDISSSAPLIYTGLDEATVSNSARLGVPPLRLSTIKGGCDEDVEPRLVNDEVCYENASPCVENVSLPSGGSDKKSISARSAPIDEEGEEDYKEPRKGRRRSSKPWRHFSEFSMRSQAVDSAIHGIVSSKYFEGFFNFIIVFNCFTMGVEANQIMHYNEFVAAALEVGEHVLTALFLLELILRTQVYGWRSFIPGLSNSRDVILNFMDAFLVLVFGVLFSWVMPILALAFGFSTKNSVVRTLTVLRAIRLLRLVRVFQRVPAFREAWLLLRGLTDSVRTLFWTCFVIMFITYIFAIFGMVGLTKPIYEKQQDLIDDPDRYEELKELLTYVGGLDLLMITLIQLLTMDSWNYFLRKMLKELPFCWIYFYAYIAVAVFVLMNLVTAIIVNNALDNAKVDEEHIVKQKEKIKKEELRSLEELFERMDTDCSGTLNWNEFKDAFADPEMSKKWKMLDFDPDECKELFSLLDDGDGEIETLEFFEGLAKMKGIAQSKDIFRLQKTMASLAESLERAGKRKSFRAAKQYSMGYSFRADTQQTIGSPHAAKQIHARHTLEVVDETSAKVTPRKPIIQTVLIAPDLELKQYANTSLHRHIRDFWSSLCQEKAKTFTIGNDELPAFRNATGKDDDSNKSLLIAKAPSEMNHEEATKGHVSPELLLGGPPWIPPAAVQNPGFTWRI